MLDYRQSEEYSQYFVKNGWKIEKVKDVIILIKRLPMLGSIIKIQRPTTVPFEEIEKIAKLEKALCVIVEAATTTEDSTYQKLGSEFDQRGYQNLKFALCPTKTSYIDLTKSEYEVLASFDEDARKTVKRNQKAGIEIKVTESLIEIYPLLKDVGKLQKFFVQIKEDWNNQWGAFGNKARVILAYKNGKLLGGNMSLVDPPVGFGLFLPVTPAGKTQNIAATLLWEGLKLAKQNGCVKFDLEGLYDERYKAPKKWLGLTAFKRKFRGHEVEFIPAKIKIYAWYLKPFGWLGLL